MSGNNDDDTNNINSNNNEVIYVESKYNGFLTSTRICICEVKSYLELSLVPENENPLEWWKVHTQAFPYLALKYQQVLYQVNTFFLMLVIS